MSIATILALLILFYWLVMLADGWRGLKSISELPEAEAHADEGNLPLVSVILTAKEEEPSIRGTIRHLLEQTYPRLEIIAINDRSRDGTGARLDELRRWSEGKMGLSIPLKVIHISNLPQGWLGKNHALYQGYRQARGQLLLFTDADVRFRPDTITRAVAYVSQRHIDHLTLAPAMRAGSFALRGFVHYFLFSLLLFLRPWRANDDSRRRQGMGIGAFNLVRRSAYEAIGTHEAIRMRADDDLELGNLLKRAGFRQRMLSGKQLLDVEWYRSLKEAVRGLEKNLFAGFRYNVAYALLGCIGQSLLFIVPPVGLLMAAPAAKLAFAASMLAQGTLYVRIVRTLSLYSAADVLLLPYHSAMLIGILARTVWLALRRGGMYWRGTFYSLDELKRLRS
jgi:glycosyltransferase involved in cell wall biosynthesis